MNTHFGTALVVVGHAGLFAKHWHGAAEALEEVVSRTRDLEVPFRSCAAKLQPTRLSKHSVLSPAISTRTSYNFD